MIEINLGTPIIFNFALYKYLKHNEIISADTNFKFGAYQRL